LVLACLGRAPGRDASRICCLRSELARLVPEAAHRFPQGKRPLNLGLAMKLRVRPAH
jgi:hypothetical protein